MGGGHGTRPESNAKAEYSRREPAKRPHGSREPLAREPPRRSRSHMITRMDLERVSQYLFILYCTTIGVALLFLPWSPGWERLVLNLPLDGLRWLVAPAARGAISGFGLVHLVWSVYELREFLRPSADEPPPN